MRGPSLPQTVIRQRHRLRTTRPNAAGTLPDVLADTRWLSERDAR